MEPIYAIRIDHVSGYVSRYRLHQVVNGCEIVEIMKDEYHYARYKEKAYVVLATDEGGNKFEFKTFEGDFSGVEVTRQKPNTNEKEMEEMLKLAGYYEN